MSKKTANLKRSQLSNAAAELNEVLEPDDPIDTKAGVEDLKEKIGEAGGLIDPEQDELTESTWTVLEVLGAAHRPAEEYTPQRGEGTSKGEEAGENEEGEAEQETVQYDSLATRIADTKKLSGLKDIVTSYDEFKKLRKNLDNYSGLQGTRQLKKAMFDALGVEPPKPAYQRRKTEGKKREGPSPFGTAVEVMCEDPDQSKDAMIKEVKKRGVDTDNAKAAIQTAHTSVRKIVGLLRQNGHMD